MQETLTKQDKGKILVAACGAHIIQDGLVALQYVLLPILAQTFGLNYTQIGILRAASNTAMATLEIPSGVLAEKFKEPSLLIFGLVCAAIGYMGVALTNSFTGIVIFFIIGGTGAAFQHSLSSALITSNNNSVDRRKALGVYNSAGDAGKLAFTGLFSLGIGIGIAWQTTVLILTFTALFLAAAIPWLCRNANSGSHQSDSTIKSKGWGIKHRWKFTWLGLTVFIDSVAQSVFFTFIAFLLIEGGLDKEVAAAGIVLALAGGMVGKFCSGYLAANLGDRSAFLLLQLLTVVALVVIVWLPAWVIMFAMPLLGLAIQGSSTVTYGSVSEFVDEKKQSRGYSLIYSLSSASSVIGPFIFGYVGDVFGLSWLFITLAILVAITLPACWVLSNERALKT